MGCSAPPGVSFLPKGLVEGGISSFWRPGASQRRHRFCLFPLEGNRPSSPASTKTISLTSALLDLCPCPWVFQPELKVPRLVAGDMTSFQIAGFNSGPRLSLWFRRAAFYPGSDHCFLSPTSLGLSLENSYPGRVGETAKGISCPCWLEFWP